MAKTAMNRNKQPYHYKDAFAEFIRPDKAKPWMVEAYAYRGRLFVDYRHLWEGMSPQEILEIAKAHNVPEDQRLQLQDEAGEQRLYIPAGFVAQMLEGEGEIEPAAIYRLVEVTILAANN